MEINVLVEVYRGSEGRTAFVKWLKRVSGSAAEVAVPNSKERSCNHILEWIDRKNVLLWSIFTANRGSSLTCPSLLP